MIKPFLLICLCLLFGCAPRPTAEQLASADYGAYPYNYQQVIDRYLAARLKDPASLQYEHIKGPTSIWVPSIASGKYGYGVCAYVNAKNSFGGYTGWKIHFFLLRDGAITKQSGGGDEIDEAVARGRCSADW